MPVDPERLVAEARRAHRVAGGVSARDAQRLEAYAEECEIAAALERAGLLTSDDIPAQAAR